MPDKKNTAIYRSDKHLRNYADERPFNCDECNKRFKKKYHLQNHSRTHTGEKPYTCDECNAKFRRKQHLECHARIHTGEKPYTCDECNARFRQKNSVVRHARTQHTGEQTYACDECNAGFKEKHQLRRHLQKHTGEHSHNSYNCDVYNKTYLQENRLISHSLTHTEDKVSDCSSSGHILTTKTNLNVCFQSCNTNNDNVTMTFVNTPENAENVVPTVIEADVNPIREAGLHLSESVPQKNYESNNWKQLDIDKGKPLSHPIQRSADVECYTNPTEVPQYKDDQSSSESGSLSGPLMFNESFTKQCDINLRSNRFTSLEDEISQKRICSFFRRGDPSGHLFSESSTSIQIESEETGNLPQQLNAVVDDYIPVQNSESVNDTNGSHYLSKCNVGPSKKSSVAEYDFQLLGHFLSIDEGTSKEPASLPSTISELTLPLSVIDFSNEQLLFSHSDIHYV